MKLKTRLIISFCVLVIIPVVTIASLMSLMAHLQSLEIQEEYGVEDSTILDNMYTPTNLIHSVSKVVYNKVKEDVGNNKDLYNDNSHIEKIAQYARKKLVSVVVCRNGQIIFNNSSIEKSRLKGLLPEYGSEYDSSELGMYYGEEIQSVIKQVDFTDSHKNQFSVYMVTSFKQVIPQVKRLLADGIVVVIFVLFVTGGLLTVWIYKAMIRPLSRLTLATNNIKEGNLDFEMNVKGDDEIAYVCRNFEEMRLILKKTTQEQLKADQEEKELIRNISHDLKTPLTAIRGYVEGLMDGVADTPQKQEKYLRTIANKVNDMDKLINELTIYSRIDTNRIPYNFEKVCINEYWEDCCEEIATELEAKGIRLDYASRLNSSKYVVADVEQLKRVINNIISNCVKYINHDHGIISIELSEEDGYLVNSIADNGKGIGENDLPHIFERFYRADSSRNSQEGGSGIGLAIVKKIVEDHKGNITAKSEEGVGTQVIFRLPEWKEIV